MDVKSTVSFDARLRSVFKDCLPGSVGKIIHTSSMDNLFWEISGYKAQPPIPAYHYYTCF